MRGHDRPDPVELITAVREFLDQPPGDRDTLHRKVASNVLALVARELADDPADHDARLASLGVADDEELARLAASMEECDALYPALTAAMAAWAEAKVRVVDPRYLEAR